MIRELGKVETRFTETELSSPKTKKASNIESFGRGFVEGYGSVGYIFTAPRACSRKKSFAKKLGMASGRQRQAIVAIAKKNMMAKYVDDATVNKLYSVSTGMREDRARRVDALMMHRDFVTAISKVDD